MVSVSIGIEESNLAVRSEGEEREEEVRNEGKKEEGEREKIRRRRRVTFQKCLCFQNNFSFFL